MMQGFITIPFKTESAHGLTKVNGVAKFSAAGIILDFESKLLGLIGVEAKEVRVPLGEILDIRFRKGVFKHGAKIVIRMRTFAKLAELPNNDGKLILKLARDDFELGQSAVEQLQKDLAGQNESLASQQTPIGQLFQDESEEETKTLE